MAPNVKNSFRLGDIVWAKVSNTWWPSMIVDPQFVTKIELYENVAPPRGQVLVQCFCSPTFGHAFERCIREYRTDNEPKVNLKLKKKTRRQIRDARAEALMWLDIWDPRLRWRRQMVNIARQNAVLRRDDISRFINNFCTFHKLPLLTQKDEQYNLDSDEYDDSSTLAPSSNDVAIGQSTSKFIRPGVSNGSLMPSYDPLGLDSEQPCRVVGPGNDSPSVSGEVIELQSGVMDDGFISDSDSESVCSGSPELDEAPDCSIRKLLLEKSPHNDPDIPMTNSDASNNHDGQYSGLEAHCSNDLGFTVQNTTQNSPFTNDINLTATEIDNEAQIRHLRSVAYHEIMQFGRILEELAKQSPNKFRQLVIELGHPFNLLEID